MYNIKINEMLLRDGLQSLPKIYTIEKKLELYNLIKETNISFIEFGSTTAKNILPQMSNSYELYELIKHDKEDKNLIILCTSINGVKKSVNININNYSLVCSLSDDFGKHNLHCSSDLSFSKILEQLEYLIKNRFNLVRIYISCSFGCIVDKFNKEYINKLITWLNKLMLIVNIHFLKPDNFDIVLCDTFSIVDNTSLDEILLTIKNNCNFNIFEYIALHLHVDKTKIFTNLIDIGLKYKINKYDSSICGIGSCPFIQDKNYKKGNICTLELVKYVTSKNYNTNINIEILEKNSLIIQNLLKN